ncbi:MAG: hypothetical protein OIN87_01650 [Candidatus Methanoperedens sp.]|nr:hypothetical protein [Candidatus Methanoperedens sp.]
MVRLEREGDSFVFITGKTEQSQDITILINAISELKNNPPDHAKIKDGLIFLDKKAEIDIRKEIRTLLMNSIEKKENEK